MFLSLSGLSFIGNDDLQVSKALAGQGKEGEHFCLRLPLLTTHKHWNIYLLLKILGVYKSQVFIGSTCNCRTVARIRGLSPESCLATCHSRSRFRFISNKLVPYKKNKCNYQI